MGANGTPHRWGVAGASQRGHRKRIEELMTRILHRGLNLPEIEFSDEGIRYEHPFAGSLTLGWSDVKFVSLVPALTRTDAGWTEKNASNLDRWKRDRCVEVSVVLRDRRPFMNRASWWRRPFLHGALRPLYDGDWRPLPDEAYLRFDVWERFLDVPIDDFLDALASKTRIGLLVDF